MISLIMYLITIKYDSEVSMHKMIKLINGSGVVQQFLQLLGCSGLGEKIYNSAGYILYIIYNNSAYYIE